VRTLSRGELVVLVLLLVLPRFSVRTVSQPAHPSTPRSRYSKNRIRSFVPGEPRGLTDSDCGDPKGLHRPEHVLARFLLFVC